MTLTGVIQKDGQRHLYVKSAITSGTSQYQVPFLVRQRIVTYRGTPVFLCFFTVKVNSLSSLQTNFLSGNQHRLVWMGPSQVSLAFSLILFCEIYLFIMCMMQYQLQEDQIRQFVELQKKYHQMSLCDVSRVMYNRVSQALKKIQPLVTAGLGNIDIFVGYARYFLFRAGPRARGHIYSSSFPLPKLFYVSI